MADNFDSFYVSPDAVDAAQDAAQDSYDNGGNPAQGYDSRADVMNRLQQQGVGTNSALGFYSSLLGDQSQPLTRNQVNSIFSDLGNDQYKTTVFDNLKKDDSTTTGAEVGTTAYKKVGDNDFDRAESHANDLAKQMADNNGTLPPLVPVDPSTAAPLPYAPTDPSSIANTPGQQAISGTPPQGGTVAPPAIGTAPGDPSNATQGGSIMDILSAAGKSLTGGNGFLGGNGPIGGLSSIGNMLGVNGANGQSGGFMGLDSNEWGRRLGMMGAAAAAYNNPGAWSAYASLAGQNTKENNLTKLGTGKDAQGQYMLFQDARGNLKKQYLPDGYLDTSAENIQLKRDKMNSDFQKQQLLLQQREADRNDRNDRAAAVRQAEQDKIGTQSKFQDIADTNQTRADDALYVANEANRLREAITSGQFTPSMLAEAKMRFDNGTNGSTPADRFLKDSVALFESAASNRVAAEKGAGTQFKLEQAKRQFLPDGAKYDTGAMLDSLGRLSGIATRQANGADQTLQQVYARPGMRDQASQPNPNSKYGDTENADYYQDQVDDLRDRNADHDVADRAFQQSRDARNYPTQSGSSFQGTGGSIGLRAAAPHTLDSDNPQAAFDKLPSGAIYIGPDGVKRKKP